MNGVQVMDWRDALERMKNVRIKTNLEPLLATVPLHHHVVLVRREEPQR